MVIWEAFQRTRGRVNQSSTAPTKNWSTARVLSAFSSPSPLHPTDCTSELSSRPSSNIMLAACSSSNSQSTLMLDASHAENLLQLCLSTAWACMHPYCSILLSSTRRVCMHANLSVWWSQCAQRRCSESRRISNVDPACCDGIAQSRSGKTYFQ